MIAFAEAEICGARCLGTLKVDGYHVDPKIADEIVND